MSGKRREVLITTSPYTTLLYFLMTDLRDIKDTFYFFVKTRKWSKEEKISTKDKLPNSYFLYEPPLKSRFRKFKILQRIYIIIQIFIKHTTAYLFTRFTRNYRWPFLKSADIYAYDGTPVPSGLIADSKYTFLEEGLYTYENADRYADIKHMSKGFRLWTFLISPFGPAKLGTSDQAVKIILTGLAEIPKCYRKKNTEIISMNDLWEKSSGEKKAFIMKFFNLTEEDSASIQQREIIFVDQPLAHDGEMTDDEQIEMMRKIFARYGESKILLKTHYRNSLNYSGIFPDVYIWDKLTPMELLILCGVNFKRAVTINSTAVLSLPKSIKIDWLGDDVNSPYFSHFSPATRRIFVNDFIGGKTLPERIKSQENTKQLQNMQAASNYGPGAQNSNTQS